MHDATLDIRDTGSDSVVCNGPVSAAIDSMGSVVYGFNWSGGRHGDRGSGRHLGLLHDQVTGPAGSPAHASAVELSVRATLTEGAGFLAVYPRRVAHLLSSSLHYTKGATVGKSAIAQVGAGGNVYGSTLSAPGPPIEVPGHFLGG